MNDIGISGFAVYVPPYRVQLRDWCEWSGDSWDKVGAVIGNSFRVPGPEHNMYTMAASAALRLIDQYKIDPGKVGYLALGTETSSDNATSGAVIIRGLLDQALIASGRKPLARDIEAPEFKQACIAGVYGLKGALRYLAVDGADRVAIVVAADIAEYARGSSGESTQGAGAVAMLLEHHPKLLTVDIHGSASASRYRAVDFRKPFMRFARQALPADGRLRDFPVFNGKYSTACYTDETLSSMDTFFSKQRGSRRELIKSLSAVFMHRPYHRMPVAAWTLAYLFALAAEGGDCHEELSTYAAAAGVDMNKLLAEMSFSVDFLDDALKGRPTEEPFPLCLQVVKAFRASPVFTEMVDKKLKLGSGAMRELGNLYSGALPAWLAAGLEESLATGCSNGGDRWLLIGYGSGDTSEVLSVTLAHGWQQAAAQIQMKQALTGAIDLNKEQYEALHDGREPIGLVRSSLNGFVIDRVGTSDSSAFQDIGIEYFRYAG